jgi:CubicO group peptidase (beta-lactamase class C family)
MSPIRVSRALFAALALFAGCTTVRTAPSSSAASAPQQLAADTPMKTASGLSFEAPKGWWLSARGELIVLEDPERDLTITVVEVKDEPDAVKAMEAAWQRAQPGFSRKVQQKVEPPVSGGWDAFVQLIYEMGGEHRAVVASARRRGATQYVLLLDGAEAGWDRRAAQLQAIVGTLKAPGVEEESLAGRAAKLGPEQLKALEDFLVGGMAKTRVPGVAVGIVKDGQLVWEKGFGLREQGQSAPVTPDTLFMIGSNTKSLTTFMMARLVDQGKFGWDTKVTSLYPQFALGDADMTSKVLMKHTVCACAGLPRQDMEFVFRFAGVTPEQRVESMKSMKPTTGFGETFQYSNTMVSTGGYVAARSADPERELGAAYDDVMQRLVFDALGMKSSTLDMQTALSREHASPHGMNLALEYVPVSAKVEEMVVSIRPAGAAWSSVREMARYVALELAKGKTADGAQLVSEANLLARREPMAKMSDKASYGLGLIMQTTNGIRVVGHGGNTHGFTTDMFWLPDHGIGVVLLVNAGGANGLRAAFQKRVLEILFDGKPEAAARLEFAEAQMKEEMAKFAAKLSAEPDPSWTQSLAGTYVDASLGQVVLSADGKRGLFDAGEWKSSFGKLTEEDGTVKIVLLDPAWLGFDFRPETKDGRRSLVLEAPQQKYVFEETSPAKR